MAEEQQESQDSASRAKDKADAWDKAHDTMRELEEKDDPPTDLKEWPDDEAKYVTYGGGEGDHGYEEGPESKLGPSSLRRHEDGSVEIEGEKVDNPEDYKADEPIEPAVQTADERADDDGDGDDDDDDDDDDDRD
jgi:hypothetical protein